MGFGFVIVKFALLISKIPIALSDKVVIAGKGYSANIGIIMVALGSIMATFAYVRYSHIEKQLTNNAYFLSKWLSLFVILSIVNDGILFIT